jgi:hypothetical protein
VRYAGAAGEHRCEVLQPKLHALRREQADGMPLQGRLSLLAQTPVGGGRGNKEDGVGIARAVGVLIHVGLLMLAVGVRPQARAVPTREPAYLRREASSTPLAAILEYDPVLDAREAAGAASPREMAGSEVRAGLLIAFWRTACPPARNRVRPTFGILGGPQVVLAMQAVLSQRADVRHFLRSEEVGACEVLYVSSAWLGWPEELLERLKGRPTLTVGSLEGFCAAGGMVEFSSERVLGQERMRFLLRPKAMAAAGLDPSELMQVAPTIFKE